MKFYTHNTTSIFVIDVKFHKNPLFRLRDVQFFQTAGVKINGSYNRDTLLRQQLLPAIRSVSGDFFTFQQDSAPAHRARETVELLSAETPDFISPMDWPPNRVEHFDCSTAMETHDLWVMLFKNSYFSKVKADLYETM